MTDQDALRQTLDSIFALFLSQDIEFAVLNTAPGKPIDVTSDVDIVVANPPPESVEPTLRMLELESGARCIQKLHYDIPNCYYYVVEVPYGESSSAFLQLDCLHDPQGIGRYCLKSTWLLRNVVVNNNVPQLNATARQAYVLMKRVLKKNAHQDNLEAITTVPLTLRPEALELLGKKATSQLVSLHAIGDTCGIAATLVSANRAARVRMAVRRPFRAIKRVVLTLSRQVQRIMTPTGLFVVIVGPDGSGKSTMAEHLISGLSRGFRRTLHFHWRPGLLPALNRTPQKKGGTARAEGRVPPRVFKYGMLVSSLRLSYYTLDFLLGYWLKIWPKKTSSTLIVGERYFLDMIVDPVRYGFNVPVPFLRLISKVVPKPDMTIVLTGNPVLIQERKQELTIDDTRDLISKYEEESNSWGTAVRVDTTTGPIQPFNDATNHVTSFMTHRNSNIPNHLVSFPKYGRPRYIIDCATEFAVLDQLHAPNNPIARTLFKQIKLGSKLAALLVGRTASADQRLPPTLNWIHTRLQSEFIEKSALKISYYLGSGSLRTKLTAQISDAEGLVAYAKIAESPIAKMLVKDEEFALRQLETHPEIKKPLVSNAFEENDLSILITSVPPKIASAKKVAAKCALNRAHLSYVNRLSLLNAETITLADLLDRTSLLGEISKITNPSFIDTTQTLKSSITSTLAKFRDRTVKVSLSHGDFCPWNMLSLGGDGELYLFDWEYSTRIAPIGVDLIHYIRSQQQFIFKSPATKSIEAVLSDSIVETFSKEHGLDRIDVILGMIFYFQKELLEHLKLFAEEDEVQSHQRNQISFLSQCLVLCDQVLNDGKLRNSICLSAYACEPDKGSEPGVGWKWVSMAAETHNVWVFTKANNKRSIEKHLEKVPNPNLHFEYVNVPKWLSFWKSGQRGVRTYYYLWQWFALYQARKVHKRVEFDFGHHVTFVNDWLGTFLAFMPFPFIWGPIGSHPPIPKQLRSGGSDRLRESLRLLIQRATRLVDPLFLASIARAKKIMPINKTIRAQFPFSAVDESRIVIEPALGADTLERTVSLFQDDSRFRLLFVGRFHPTKCPDLAIEAFAKAAPKIPNATLTLIGRGPMEDRLKSLAQDTCPENSVEFVSWMERDMVLEQMQNHSAFLFPSSEGGGMVVVEALALGLPTICLDYGGPGEMVNDATGQRIGLRSREEVISDLSKAIMRYHSSPSILAKHSANCIQRATVDLSWDGKARRIAQLYDEFSRKTSMDTS